jgi:sterol desaturase/sphingolipid hydroxylase (fatty acid hydroxylase superfamily)
MSTITPLPKRPRPLPDPKHRKQTFWQIWVPLSLSILVILFLAVLAAVSAGTSASPTVTKWSYLSTIYLVTPILIGGFVVLAILGAIVYGMAKLLEILPIYTRIVQGFFRKMGGVIRKWSDKTVQPVLAIKSWWAGFEAARKRIGL